MNLSDEEVLSMAGALVIADAILRDVAALDPLIVTETDRECRFCSGDWTPMELLSGLGGEIDHQPSCVWLRAQELAG